MNVLVVEPEKAPYMKEIDGSLNTLQKEVGGCIEAIYPFEEPVGLVCNEEGKITGQPLNRALRSKAGKIYDILAGTFLVVGLGEEDFKSLPEDMVTQFMHTFETPETFLDINGEICAVPIDVSAEPEMKSEMTMAQWLEKYNGALACKRTLTDNFALQESYHNRAAPAFLDQLITKHGYESFRYVAVETINHAAEDKRYSRAVRAWAADNEPFPQAPGQKDEPRSSLEFFCNVHPVIMNELVGKAMNKEKAKPRTEPVR